MDVSPATALLTLLMGTLSGSLGAMLGIGGGVFLVPFLILVVGLPFHQAAAVSLAAPASRMTDRLLPKAAAAVIQTAGEISKRLGHRE